MKQRSTEILYRLVEAPSHRLRLETLLEDYRISEKTLRMDIASASDFAQAPTGGSLVVMTAHHVQLATGAAKEVQALLDSMDFYEYRLSLEERKSMIAARLLARGHEEWLTTQQVADEFYVSRNTVVADMRAVEGYLASYGIELVTMSNHGMRAEARDDEREDLLIGLFSRLLTQGRSRHDFYRSKVEEALGYTVSAEQITRLVRTFLRDANIFLTASAELEIVSCLTVRLNEAPVAQDQDEQVGESELDTIGRLIVRVAERTGKGVLSRETISSIEEAVLNCDLLPQLRRFDDFDLYCAISHFLLMVGRELDVSIQNDDVLVEALLTHIKSVTDWNADGFDFTTDDPTGPIVGMVEAAAQPHFAILEGYLHRTLDASMRASVVIHICAALYRIESEGRTCNVLVVSPGTMATSRYLEAQVRSYFRLNVVASTLKRDVDAGVFDDRQIDFVISTVPLTSVELPVIVVNPVLSVEDINAIQASAFRHSYRERPGRHQMASIIPRLTEIYARSSRHKVAALDQQISSLIDRTEDIERATIATSPLLKLLPERFVSIEPEEISWRAAIRRASWGMLREGYVRSSYVDKAIENVEELGTYIIINQGIALAHAAREDGVIHSGMALLVSRDGITFDTGEIVYLMFFSAQQDAETYLDLFKEIARLANDGGEFELLRESETPEEAYQHLVEALTDYTDLR